jgi:general secretion pathway protein D
MSHRKSLSVRSLLSAAALFAGGIGIAQPVLAQSAESPSTAAISAGETLAKAKKLVAEGKLVAAKDLLVRLTASGSGVSLTDSERAAAFENLNSINRKLKSLNPFETSLQSAELALTQDDLRNAERQAQAVLGSAQSFSAQKDRAQRLLDSVSKRRSEMLPEVVNALDNAGSDLESGRYADARAKLDLVGRSGVALDGAQHERFESYQSRVLAAEQTGQVVATAPVETQPAVAAPSEAPAVAQAPAAQPASTYQGGQDAPLVSHDPKGDETTPSPYWQGQNGQQAAPVAQAAQPADAAAPAAAAQPADDLVTIARKFEAGSLLAEADHAFDASRLNDAGAKYQKVLDVFRQFLSPEQTKHAEDRLAEIKTRMRGSAPAGLSDVIADREVAKQAALAEFTNQLSLAQRALDSGDTGRARDLASQARVTINTGRNLFAESEFQDLAKQVDAKLSDIDAKQGEISAREAAQRSDALKRQADQTARQRASEKERKILESIDRVRALQKEMKYEEALQVVDQILFLDPISPAGLLLKDVLTDAKIYRQYNQIQSRIQSSLARHALENAEATIAPSALVDFPADWPSISQRRGEPVNFAEPPENRRVLSVLESKRIPVEFKENTLADVVGFIETVTQQNIDVDWQSLEQIGVTKEAPVSLKLTNVPVKIVLDRVMEKVSPDPRTRAGWAIQDGVLTIASDASLRQNKVLVIYDIRDLLVEVPNFTDAPTFDLQSVLQSSEGGGGGQSPFQSQGTQNQALTTRTLQERTDEVIGIITRNVDKEGWETNGGDTGFIEQLNGSLIITNTPRNHREIAGLLRKLREVRNMQINVEARLLLVSQDFYEKIGFDIDVYFNANNNQVRTARANDPSIQASDFFDFTNGGGLNRSVTGAQIDTNGDGTPDQFLTQPVVNPRNTSPVGAAQNSLGLTDAIFGAAVRSSTVGGLATAAAPALGIAGQFLDDIQVDFLIQATQADRRTVSLTAPRLTFTNGQTANIFVARQQSFVSDLQPVVSESAVGFDPDIAALSTGVRLLIDGVISADRRYVQMNVDFQISELQGFGQQTVTAVAGGQLVNSASTGSVVQLPLTTVTGVRTTVNVPDQGTILLGGQRVTNEIEVETGVPVLSKIPILNRFFSNRIKSQEESTLLILLKPTILIQNEEEERNFPGLLDSLKLGTSR